MNFAEIKSYYLDALNSLGVSEIKEISSEDIACKCPICGDSRFSKSKKRLHLYKKGEVINVNCFNGDCPAKNLTPWNFFKTYAPRVFNQFREASRKQYLRELKVFKEPQKLKVDLGFLDDLADIKNENQSKLLKFIEDFEPGLSGQEDLDKIRTFLGQNPECVNEFKASVLS